MRKSIVSVLALITCFVFNLSAQDENGFKVLGKIKTLAAKEIKTSRWSIGGETLDRDYANYNSYKNYLNDLGAKRIRLQGGWARCEKEKGKYNFAWLDSIIDDAIARGVQPWLQLSYGNPIYEGGGQAALAGGIPTSEEALKAWDNWVVATVNHFKGRITEWEIWNEPDLSKKFFAKDFNPFYERTVASVRKQQADARIIALGLASLSRIYYVDSLLMYLKDKNKLSYANVISYHGYSARPEDSYPHIEKLFDIVNKYDRNITLWQGENGAPSTEKGKSVGALTNESWSEITQAKWDIRRMLGDMAYGIEVTNIFQISDMYYDAGDHMAGLNSKGLLKARPDRTIERSKLSYSAYQHTATLFRDKVEKSDLTPNHSHEGLWIYAFTRTNVKSPAIAFWFANEKPQDEYPSKPITFIVDKFTANLNEVVMVNLLTGEVSQVPSKNITKVKNGYRFDSIPATDSPMVICHKSWVTY